jgi:hypothetical protein
MSATTITETVHVSSGEHVHESGRLIAEGDAHVVNHAVVDAWDESTIEALPGSTTYLCSDDVTVRKHVGARIVQKKGLPGSQATISEV